ncbi:MAG: hypothetical protein U0228_06450 [Myxococcaceae bacterium]
MEPTDLTVKILQEMRDDMRQMKSGQDALREEMRQGRELAERRFEAIETALRDLAEQMVMVSRGIKVAIEARSNTEGRLDDHERRLRALETNAH